MDNPTMENNVFDEAAVQKRFEELQAAMSSQEQALCWAMATKEMQSRKR